MNRLEQGLTANCFESRSLSEVDVRPHFPLIVSCVSLSMPPHTCFSFLAQDTHSQTSLYPISCRSRSHRAPILFCFSWSWGELRSSPSYVGVPPVSGRGTTV